MTRTGKRLLMIGTDLVLIPLALWAGFALRLGDPLPAVAEFWWLFFLLPALSIPLFHMVGFYRTVVRYMGPPAVIAVLKGVTLSALTLSAAVFLVGLYGFPRAVLVLYWLLLLLGVGGSRFVARALLQSRMRPRLSKAPVIIYGAGNSGAQLARALSEGNVYDPVAMLDDDRALRGSVVAGLKVYSPKALHDLIIEFDIEHVLLAMPSASRERRRAILQRLEPYPVHVKTVPDMSDLVAGVAALDEIREIDVEDLLGRDPVAADPKLMQACITGKVVLVTGAGGSIGSELCRQIVQQQPAQLILFEVSEYALYRIEQELRLAIPQESPVEIVPLLGTVTDRARLREVMQVYSVQTVYHAAAYKHVPIVEHNVIEGVRNNSLGTWYTAEAAREAGVEHFILISTDKAVRPTNVMGASKRLAELVLQSMMRRGGKTIFCMVRFGNVLGSSGSVVPLFRRQIERGGPVTVTHPEITRYFMTIPEAAALVIQAGSMAQGGEVFVLDMGEPVRIMDLARKMIHLMGYRVRDADQPDGEIEIRLTGLRPGEKLYEELVIGDNISGTAHPKIRCADEWSPNWSILQALLLRVERMVRDGDAEQACGALAEVVSGYVAQDAQSPELVWQRQQTPRIHRGGGATH